MKIQSYRYEDKIQYRIDGEASLLGVEVPKLILQPIVENAIYHGIRPKKGMGTIEISYKVHENALLIEVRDDGAGYRGKDAHSTKNGEYQVHNQGDIQTLTQIQSQSQIQTQSQIRLQAQTQSRVDKSRKSEPIKAKLGGIGMANVDQRIKILCGEEYGIQISALEEGGSLVTYHLKLEK